MPEQLPAHATSKIIFRSETIENIQPVDLKNPWLENADIVAILFLAVVPDVTQCYYAGGSMTDEPAGEIFSRMLVLLIARSLQVSLPILLIIQLRNRSWKKYGLHNFRPMTELGVAVLLMAVSYSLYYVVALALQNSGVNIAIADGALPPPQGQSTLALTTLGLILAASAANGFAEELAMRAYLIPRLKDLTGSSVIAVVLTSVLFASYHSYQGLIGVVSAFTIGLVLGTYFATTNRFYPVAIAHFTMDVLPLTMLAMEST